MSHFVVVQHIQARWSQELRRQMGRHPTRSVPDALELPLAGTDLRKARFIEHTIQCDPASGAVSSQQVIIRDSSHEVEAGAVSIEDLGEQVRVVFAGGWRCGAPHREWAHQVLVVGADEWARIVYNGRFSEWEGCWYYEKHVANVGLFSEVRQDVFMTGRPTHRYAAISHALR